MARLARATALAYGRTAHFGAYSRPSTGGGSLLAALKRFEVAVYNEDVRTALQEGRRHRDLTDDWADIHYIDVEARDAQHARNKAETRYPENRGSSSSRSCRRATTRRTAPARQSRANARSRKSSRSCPQNSSPRLTYVGAPNTPNSMASRVSAS